MSRGVSGQVAGQGRSSHSTLLMYGAPRTSPDLFHAVPASIGDPFLYAEVDGRQVAVVGVLDGDRVRALGIELIHPFELGGDELLNSGLSRLAFDAEIALRACRQLGVSSAIVPPGFPLSVGDHLRAGGIELHVDAEVFIDRRRVKAGSELTGVRRAQAAADVAMAVGGELVRELRPGLTSEDVRAAMELACVERGCELNDAVVAHGAHAADAHERGHGEIVPGEAVIVDIFPRDRASHCWADMTRTFVAGGRRASEVLLRDWEITREALERVSCEVRAGADAEWLYGVSCDPFEARGIPTLRSKPIGTRLDEGYYHSLGHGVGLEVHERPILGRTPDTLIAGDVIALEPGCYRKGFGGVRLEDLVLVGETGSERLTNFPYDL